MTEHTANSIGSGRRISKKAANRVAAARVYVAASKKAGKPVPASVKRLASQGR